MALFHTIRVAAVPPARRGRERRGRRIRNRRALERQLREVQRQLAEIKAGLHPADGATVKPLQRDTAAQYDRVQHRLDAQPRVGLEDGRLRVSSADGAFSLALRGTVQFDTAYFAQGRNPPSVDLNSGTNFRRAQFGFVGTLRHDWAYNYDFGATVEQRGHFIAPIEMIS